MSEVRSREQCKCAWPEDHDKDDNSDHQGCCWRETVDVEGVERCIWHADYQSIDKSAKALQKARATSAIQKKNSPYDELLDGAKLQEIEPQNQLSFENVALRDAELSLADLQGSTLRRADLSGANFHDADLQEADLRDADLSNARFDEANLSKAKLYDADLSGANFHDANLPEVALRRADLSGANFHDADLQEVDLRDAELSETNFRGADLSEAILRDIDFSGEDLRDANLSGADLRGANLSGSDLRNVNLSEARLGRCELTGATLRNASFNNVSVDESTTCETQDEGYDKQRPVNIPVFRRIIRTRPRWWPGVGKSNLDTKNWAATAQAYHDLKQAFSNHGLIGKARQQHLRERGARKCHAWAAFNNNVTGVYSENEGNHNGESYYETINNTGDGDNRENNYNTVDEGLRWFRSVIVWQLTGYGVSVRRILRNMGTVFVFATFAYLFVEFQFSVHPLTEDYSTVPEIIYYSTITFTTTPPVMPSSNLIKVIVMAEALLGTLCIVFLGYVLGTREQF